LTDFYAYFALTGTATVRVGAVSERHALTCAPEPFELLQRLATGEGEALALRDVEAELVNLLPRWQAEEHALDVTELVLAGPPPEPDAPPVPRGLQRLYDLDVRLTVRAGYVVSAPAAALARARTDAALADTARLGFAALDPDAVPFARVEPLAARPWRPAGRRPLGAVA